MRRFVGAAIGVFIGVLLISLCIFALSRFEIDSGRVATACGDFEHCRASWWVAPANVLALCLPVIAFAWVGYLSAARRWSLRRTSVTACGMALAVVALVSAKLFV